LTSSSYFYHFFSILRPPPSTPLFPYTTLFRSRARHDQMRARVLCLDRHLRGPQVPRHGIRAHVSPDGRASGGGRLGLRARRYGRSEEHTSELQSLRHLVCRLLLEKKKKKKNT